MVDDKEKVYTPTVISEEPFPQEEQGNFDTSQLVGQKSFSPETIEQQKFPIKKIATELLSASLNTRSKKILQEFQFTESGALQIGKYTEGISGDLRLSPTGILGRDIAGETTFALDAETGDAIFKGIVRAGTLIGGDNKVQVGASNNGGNISIFDSSGNLSIFIGYI